MPRKKKNEANGNGASAGTGLVMAPMSIGDIISVTASKPLHLTGRPWWTKLSPDEQKRVEVNGTALAQAMVAHGKSGLAMGSFLQAIQADLEPHSLFGRFLKEDFRMPVATAYRYIRQFKSAQEKLSKPIVDLAMARGVDIIGQTEERPFGRYTEAVKHLPPPSNPTPEQAETWLTQVENVRKGLGKNATTATMDLTPRDPQEMLKETYRVFVNRFSRLPRGSKTRQQWLRALIGMCLTKAGISNATSFEPVAIPEVFDIGRGRPKEKKANGTEKQPAQAAA